MCSRHTAVEVVKFIALDSNRLISAPLALVDRQVMAGFGAIAEGEQPAFSLSNCSKGYWARSYQYGSIVPEQLNAHPLVQPCESWPGSSPNPRVNPI